MSWNKYENKTGVINDRQGSSMIHSASPQTKPAVIVAWFGSFGTDGRTLCVKIVITSGWDCWSIQLFSVTKWWWVYLIPWAIQWTFLTWGRTPITDLTLEPNTSRTMRSPRLQPSPILSVLQLVIKQGVSREKNKSSYQWTLALQVCTTQIALQGWADLDKTSQVLLKNKLLINIK